LGPALVEQSYGSVGVKGSKASEFSFSLQQPMQTPRHLGSEEGKQAGLGGVCSIRAKHPGKNNQIEVLELHLHTFPFRNASISGFSTPIRGDN
jgi:hypothetical protein